MTSTCNCGGLGDCCKTPAPAQQSTAEQLAKLAHYTAKLHDVDTYEQIRIFRAFSNRCAIATEWQKTLIALEMGPALGPLPSRLVRESRKQLEALQATIKQMLANVCK